MFKVGIKFVGGEANTVDEVTYETEAEAQAFAEEWFSARQRLHRSNPQWAEVEYTYVAKAT